MKRGLALVVLTGLSGCHHAASGTELGTQLAGRPGSYVGGTLSSAVVQVNLDRRDFVYDLELDATDDRAAYVHLAAKVFRLAVMQGTPDLLSPTPTKLLADVPINSNEIDVEAVAFSPDGQRIAAASHDRSVRLFDGAGNRVAEAVTEEPLTAVAFSPDGLSLVVGSDEGLLTVLDARALTYRSELRAHHDAVRALAFDDAGTLWSGGYDKQVRSFTLASADAPLTEVRLHPRKIGGVLAIGTAVPTAEGTARLDLGVDERTDRTLITLEAAQRLGIEVGLLKTQGTQSTPGGTVSVPLAERAARRFKALTATHVPVGICSSCVPQGLDGVLGRDFLSAHPLVQDATTHELVIQAAPGEADPSHVTVVLHPGATWGMPGLVADLTVSRDGAHLGVALDEAKPERNLVLYQREKAGQIEPALPGNLAVIVDAKSGAILEKHGPHTGVVSSAAISPDGRSIASGGWDRKVYVFSGSDTPVASLSYGWSVRRVRFTHDGRLLSVAAWTPQNAQNADSDPSAQLLRLDYADASILPR